jgi:DNA-binding SARP family transcriptional activator
MDDLWPDQAPQPALNSLHQTLFFLRRLLEPWHEDGLSSAYIRMEADVVMLNPELIQIDSVAFHRQAMAILGLQQAEVHGPAILRLYGGTFAPEFEYEPWAEDWRTTVHATFLRLADSTTRTLAAKGAHSDVADILTHVARIDPMALELRGRLIHALSCLGAKDAAAAHYRGLRTAYERELGETPPSFSDLAGGVDSM